MNEKVDLFKVIGIYVDTLKKHDFYGNVLEEIKTEPKKNIIVASISPFMAGLIQGAITGGSLYFALGTGTQVATTAVTTLANEITRLQASINFVDNSNNPTSSITNKIAVSASWAAGVLGTVTLTEFGIFGGNNANLPNSGYALDYVAHSPISIDNTISLDRTIYFTF